MKGYVINIEKAAKENENFRKVLYTAKNSQLVLMSLEPGEEIGEEVHNLDQFIRIEEGEGRIIIDGQDYRIEEDWAAVIPAGARHNVINDSDREIKLYTIYSPPEHKDAVVHQTRAAALADTEDHFDGVASE